MSRPSANRWQRAGRVAARGGLGAARRGRAGAGLVASKLITVSAARGARASGLTALIWNQVLSFGADAMITVALAGTVFFGASPNAQRGNVLEYLLVTVAPFALVAPVIGPAMDRLQHGRRLAMAGTAIGRAVLAIVMATHFTSLLVLFPAALGSLVLSKAYSVIRAAAAPRLVPPGMTLVEANSRLSVFGLGASLVGGGLIGAVIKLTGSYPVALLLTALAFGGCAYYALRLPRQVDAIGSSQRDLRRSTRSPSGSLAARIAGWATRGWRPTVTAAVQAGCGLRFLTGFLSLFLAFYVQQTAHGWRAAVLLGAVVLGAGAGNAVGNLVGTRLQPSRPHRVVLLCLSVASATVLIGALVFNPLVAVVGIAVASAAAALGKIGLDSVVQHDVAEPYRASAFGRSETFLQLAWVLGATIGVLLPSTRGGLGFLVAGALSGALTVVLALHSRTLAGQYHGRPQGRPVN